MNDGMYAGRQVLPSAVLKATLEPAIALPNTMAEARGYWELLNSAYGAGREISTYRGHLLTYHGGDLPGFHSQISYMPRERIGVIVLVIGDHCSSLGNTVTYNVYERLLGLGQTPWSERLLERRLKGKKARTEARARAGGERIPDTKPSHALSDYVGEYEHPAYGVLKIGQKDSQLPFDFHKMQLPLTHFHFDRFDTPDDEEYGKWSVNFQTNPLGDIDKAVMSLDEGEAVFIRKPETLAPEVLRKVAGAYETPTGDKLQVVLKEDGFIYLVEPGGQETKFEPYKGLKFRVRQFSDRVREFVIENGEVKALKLRDHPRRSSALGNDTDFKSAFRQEAW